MRRINLLSPEEQRRRPFAIPVATRGGILGILLIAGAVLVLAMVGFYLFYYIRLGNEEDQAAELDQEIARQQGRVGELAPYSDLRARLDAKKGIADGVFRTRFAWDELLQGLAFVIPDSTALDSFSGQAARINTQQQSGRTGGAQNLEPPGSITFTGVALPDYQNVADFVVRMDNLRFLANAQLDNAQLDRQTFDREAITFEVSSDLVTRIGENGNEVNIGGDESGNGGSSSGGQASRPQGPAPTELGR